ncbi:hypothetical protein BJY01DRAFT_32850 [Aspergillus pseudoustus]|uniref:OefB n=1 Tax=Aspergillus pseudoustus TaxID=1810923 RepID=A0ABR4JGH2_9EURO
MVYPFQPWSRDPSSIRSSPSEASSSNHHAYYDLSFSTYSPMSSMPPPPPPPSLNDDLLDINPRKCSFSSNSMNNACAFPSWPNRPSLISASSEGSSASAYLSDEDLFPEGPITPEPIDEESAALDPRMGSSSLTTEQQIQLLRAAAEEEAQRARFLAQVQAHAKAQQAIRVAQLAATEKESSKRTKKRKPIVAEKKRRTTSSSKSVVYRS